MLQTSRAQVLDSLKQRLRQISRSDSLSDSPVDVTSTGIGALDHLLPLHGLPRGGMVEWLTCGSGAGAMLLALAGVKASLERGGWWVVIDPRGDFFPISASGWGIPLDRLVLVRPSTARDAAWAFEQALRCPGISVAWYWPETAGERTLQRWKVAAEMGQGQGVLFRPFRTHRQVSWADVRWLVQPVQRDGPVTIRRWHLDLAYCRGVLNGQGVELECDDETGIVRLAAPLAYSTLARRQARA